METLNMTKKGENTDLIKLPEGGEVAKADDAVFKAATKAGDYLPRLQLLTSNSEIVKDGKFPMNHFAIVRDQNNQDIGDAVDILVIAWRAKAIEIGEEIITSFDPKEEIFKSIQDRSGDKDSGCMFGPEFLVWVPVAETFATFFMASKSMRREAPAVRGFIKKAATLKPKKISTPKYTWYSPTVHPCTSVFDIPKQPELEKEHAKFMNPPAPTVEKAPETEGSDRAR
jgi:hypothetical protein